MATRATVLAFPGQGSLAASAGVPWAEHPSFKIVADVGATVGVDVAGLVTRVDADLVATENAQLGTFALSLCVLDATGLAEVATLALGHSLGEYTALVAAGIVSMSDAARLVAARGEAMRAAADAEPGGLVAVIGGDLGAAQEACAQIPGLYLANLNGPGQIVLGGATPALATLAERVKELGFRRAIPLRVGGAFHTPLMASAADALGPALAATTFLEGHAAVLANVDGKPHAEPGSWASLLLHQLTEPVRFDECVRALPSSALVVECGAGAVLKGLITRIRDDLEVISIAVPDDLAQSGIRA
jgi:[acyl-carrier-protein] S-malonyltransferase